MDAASVLFGRPSRRYGLVVRDETSSKSFELRHRDVGVSLSDDGLAWSTGGRRRTRSFREIDSIRLEISQGGACTIGFARGRTLAVYGVPPRGIATPAVTATYRDFVGDLHARLSHDDVKRIVFVGGSERPKRTVWLVAAALVFCALGLIPVAVAITTGQPGHLLALPFTILLVIGAVDMLWPREPRPYDPRQPDEFLPRKESADALSHSH